jgi:hypothetical protein
LRPLRAPARASNRSLSSRQAQGLRRARRRTCASALPLRRRDHRRHSPTCLTQPVRSAMHLSKLLNLVPVELTRHHASYETGAWLHPCLAPYPTLPALLDALRRTPGPSTPTRKALITSLVRIHQTSPHPVWSTVLLHVFTHPGASQETPR